MKVADMMSKKEITIQTVEQPSDVLGQKQIEQKMAEARRVCSEWGWGGEKCAMAWKLVEDLQAEEAHQQTEQLRQTAFEEYCQEHPEAKELMRGYDPWFCHWQEEC